MDNKNSVAQLKFLGNRRQSMFLNSDLEGFPAEVEGEILKVAPTGISKSKERRTPAEIMVEILRITLTGTRKTRLVYLANLNFARATKYLDGLKKCGLIRENGGLWRTTERGVQCIRDLNRISQYVANF